MKIIDCALLSLLQRSGAIPATTIPAMAAGRSKTIAARWGIPPARVHASLEELVVSGVAFRAIGGGNDC